MAQYDDLVEAQLRGGTVRCGTLVFFDFRSEAMRLWEGAGRLEAGGRLWEGIAGMGSVSPLTVTADGTVEEVTFTLFADSLLLGRITEDVEEALGREVTLYDQWFDVRKVDAAGVPVEWQTIGEPDVWFWGRMGQMNVKFDPPSPPPGAGRGARTISIPAQSGLVNAGRPAFSFFSDRDQKARGDGTDNIFARMASFVEGTVRWPVF